MNSERIRVVQYGLGPIGLLAAKTVLAKRDFELVGAIDIDPRLLERDVADLCRLERPSGIRVSNRAEEVLRVARPHVVLHSTRSRMEDVAPQLQQCLDAGCSVVSTCEELLMPGLRHQAIAERLDRLGKLKGAVLLGTGVNPGFVMDSLALMASAPCLDVRSVRIDRIVDAATRREPLQRKVGAGLTRAEFRRGAKEGKLGHVGLLESLDLLATGLAFKLDKVRETLNPVMAAKPIKTRFLSVEAGKVAGIHHVCRGYREGRLALTLDLQMYLGAPEPRDQISIKGTPSLDLTFQGGVAGDPATVGMILNMARIVRSCAPGVRTMAEVPLPRYQADHFELKAPPRRRGPGRRRAGRPARAPSASGS